MMLQANAALEGVTPQIAEGSLHILGRDAQGRCQTRGIYWTGGDEQERLKPSPQAEPALLRRLHGDARAIILPGYVLGSGGK